MCGVMCTVHISYSSAKGKSFDLEVNISDPAAMQMNEALIAYTDTKLECEQRTSEVCIGSSVLAW
jgi:hypothetical protein